MDEVVYGRAALKVPVEFYGASDVRVQRMTTIYTFLNVTAAEAKEIAARNRRAGIEVVVTFRTDQEF